jgi:hypothetical protein
VVSHQTKRAVLAAAVASEPGVTRRRSPVQPLLPSLGIELDDPRLDGDATGSVRSSCGNHSAAWMSAASQSGRLMPGRSAGRPSCTGALSRVGPSEFLLLLINAPVQTAAVHSVVWCTLPSRGALREDIASFIERHNANPDVTSHCARSVPVEAGLLNLAQDAAARHLLKNPDRFRAHLLSQVN